MSRRVLISEVVAIATIADAGSSTFESPPIAPSRVKAVGESGIMNDAIVAENAKVTFAIRPVTDLFSCEGTLTILRYAAESGFETAGFLEDFPNPTEDVSSDLTVNRGVLEYDGGSDGVFAARLQITNRSGATINISCIIGIWADIAD